MLAPLLNQEVSSVASYVTLTPPNYQAPSMPPAAVPLPHPPAHQVSSMVRSTVYQPLSAYNQTSPLPTAAMYQPRAHYQVSSLPPTAVSQPPYNFYYHNVCPPSQPYSHATYPFPNFPNNLPPTSPYTSSPSYSVYSDSPAMHGQGYHSYPSVTSHQTAHVDEEVEELWITPEGENMRKKIKMNEDEEPSTTEQDERTKNAEETVKMEQDEERSQNAAEQSLSEQLSAVGAVIVSSCLLLLEDE